MNDSIHFNSPENNKKDEYDLLSGRTEKSTIQSDNIKKCKQRSIYKFSKIVFSFYPNKNCSLSDIL